MKKIILCFFIVGFLVYIQSLFNGFVWDDDSNLFDLKNLYDVFFYTWGPFFKPLFFILINLLEFIVGKSPFFFHLLQLLLHIINACLLFILFQHFFKRNISTILSLIFLVHPGISEAVLWVSALQEPLFFLFGIVSLLFLLNEEKTKTIFPIYAFLLLSILSKETGIVFIALVFFYKIIINKIYLKKHLFYSFLILAIYLLARVSSVGWDIAKSPWVYDADFFTRLATVPAIIFKYLQIFILPIDLQIFQLWWVRNIDFSNFIFPLTVIVILFSASAYCFFRLAKETTAKKNAILFFGFWFLFGILFHSNLYAVDMTLTQRWFYLPIAGGLGLLGLTATEIVHNNRRKQVFYIVTFIIIVLLSIRTFVRTFDWKDMPTLYTHDYLVNPNNLGTQVLLANYYLASKDYQKAFAILSEAKKQYPDNENIDVILSQYYLVQGDAKTAEEILLKTQGKTSGARATLGYILVNKNPNMARKYLTDSRKLFPKDQDLIILSAIAEGKLGNKQEVLKFVELGRNTPFYSRFKDVYENILKGNIDLALPKLTNNKQR